MVSLIVHTNCRHRVRQWNSPVNTCLYVNACPGIVVLIWLLRGINIYVRTVSGFDNFSVEFGNPQVKKIHNLPCNFHIVALTQWCRTGFCFWFSGENTTACWWRWVSTHDAGFRWHDAKCQVSKNVIRRYLCKLGSMSTQFWTTCFRG